MSTVSVSPFKDKLSASWTVDVRKVFAAPTTYISDVFIFQNLKHRLGLFHPTGFASDGPECRLRLTLVEGLVTTPFTVTVVLVEKPNSVETACQILASERVSKLPWECPFVLNLSINASSFGNTSPFGNFSPHGYASYFGTSGNALNSRLLRFVIIFEEDPISVRNDDTERPIQKDFPSNLENLSVDFANLLKNETLPDVKLKCRSRDGAIPAHRAVLAARSEVFAAMFRNEMAESRSGDVDVPDVEDDVIDPFLQYVYSGKIPSGVSDEVVPGLYAAADKYAVHALRKTCRDRMVRGLTEENCLDFLTLADAHGDVDFKKSMIEYLCNHQAVFNGEAWREFAKKPSLLAMEVYQRFVERKTSEISLDGKPK